MKPNRFLKKKLLTEFKEPVLLGFIGGTGLYSMECLKPVARLTIETPWGAPSAPITISRTPSGFPVAFLSRHGEHHQYTPSTVPARANIAALKSIGVRAIVAFSAVGSLREEIAPRDFIIPNQIIDRTKGIRPSTFFDTGFVAHAGFGDPFCDELGDLIGEFGHVLKGEDDTKIKLHTKETSGTDQILVCMEGPAFSTRAESRLYKSLDGAVINMSALPEAKLAKEAEICYQMVCMSTDYDAWKVDEEPVTVETVVGNLKANSANAATLTEAILVKMEDRLKNGGFQLLQGSMKFALSTAPGGIDPEMKKKLQFLHPEHWN